jgi:NADH dehydrogenase
LAIVVIGGGLVGTELLGELTALIDDALPFCPRIREDDVQFHIFEAGPRLLHDSTPFIGEYAVRVLQRRGAKIHTATVVKLIEPGVVRWADGFVEADTIILTAGIVPNTVAAATSVERDRRGRIVTDAKLRSVSHPSVWALGDCAAVPGPDGTPYPALAQHAVREGKAVARNIAAVLKGREPKAFIYRALGSMAAFGHTRAAADVRGFALRGFFAWWMRRTYYLFQMPRWDTRVRIALDWTVALFFRPDLTKIDLASEREQAQRNCAAGESPVGGMGAVSSGDVVAATR